MRQIKFAKKLEHKEPEKELSFSISQKKYDEFFKLKDDITDRGYDINLNDVVIAAIDEAILECQAIIEQHKKVATNDNKDSVIEVVDMKYYKATRNIGVHLNECFYDEKEHTLLFADGQETIHLCKLPPSVDLSMLLISVGRQEIRVKVQFDSAKKPTTLVIRKVSERYVFARHSFSKNTVIGWISASKFIKMVEKAIEDDFDE